jgi:hypothetical protein
LPISCLDGAGPRQKGEGEQEAGERDGAGNQECEVHAVHKCAVGGGEQGWRLDLRCDRDGAEDAPAGGCRGRDGNARECEVREVGGTQQAPEDRGAEWAAELVDRVQRSGSDAASLLGAW